MVEDQSFNSEEKDRHKSCSSMTKPVQDSTGKTVTKHCGKTAKKCA